MHKPFLKIAALLGAVSVILGAFGAHALKQHLPDATVLIFETGVRYQVYHAMALLITGILFKEFPNIYIKYAGKAFIAGIILFCGSLYALTYIRGIGIQGYDWVGAVTPIGGLCMIIGWSLLFAGISSNKVR